MTSIIVLVPDTGQVLLQKNIGCSSSIPSVTYLPLGATSSYGQRFDVRLEKFRCEHHIITFLAVSEFILIVSVQRKDSQVDDEENYYFNCVMQDFAAGMVLLKGRAELDASAFTSCDINLHTNRLQRDFQMFSPFFDHLARSSAAPSVLLNTTEFLLSEKRKEFTELLESFTESCECLHACIIVGGKLLCGTSEWFKQIKVNEMRLILTFIAAIHEHTSSSITDIPIYLPYTNPNSPVRLLKVQLLSEVMLCMICANDVKIQTVLNQMDSVLATRIDLFQSVLHLKDRAMPLQSQANAHVQGFCCFSKTSRLCILSYQPHVSPPNEPKPLDKDTIRTYLCDFIKTNFEMIKHIDCQGSSVVNAESSSTQPSQDPHTSEDSTDFVDDSSELYWVKKNCKVYLLGVANYIMIALFSADTPTYPMRSITTSLLDSITSCSEF